MLASLVTAAGLVVLGVHTLAGPGVAAVVAGVLLAALGILAFAEVD